jgi:hypothetical protein
MRLRNILIIGALVRVAIMPFLAHPFDVWAWYMMCQKIIEEGPLTIAYFPPMMFYTLIPVAHVYNWLSTIFSITSIPMEAVPPELNLQSSWGVTLVPAMAFNALVKTPFLVSDLLATLLLYKTAQELFKNQGLAEKAAALWLLNPYLVWISSAWGMFDSLPALFSIASFYFLIKNRVALSSLAISISIAYKLYPILFLVPITIYFMKRQGDIHLKKSLTKFYSTFLAFSALLFFPSIHLMLGFSQGLVTMTNAGAAGGGLTYWSFAFFTPVDLNIAIAVSATLGLALLALVFWRIGKLSFKSPFSDLASAQLACVVAILLSYRIIPEQFFVWALPFIILTAVEGRVEEILLRFPSAIALLYSVTNSVLPLYLLALTPWIGDGLAAVMRLIQPLRIRINGIGVAPTFTPRLSFGSVLLAALGVFFSALMIVLLMESLIKPREKIVKRILPEKLNTLLKKFKIQI